MQLDEVEQKYSIAFFLRRLGSLACGTDGMRTCDLLRDGRVVNLGTDTGHQCFNDEPRRIKVWFNRETPGAGEPFVDLFRRSGLTRRRRKTKLLRSEGKRVGDAAQFGDLVELAFSVFIGAQGARFDLQSLGQLFLCEAMVLPVAFEGLSGK